MDTERLWGFDRDNKDESGLIMKLSGYLGRALDEAAKNGHTKIVVALMEIIKTSQGS